MENYKDFDAFFSEIQEENLTIKLYGKEYKIKKDVSAKLMISLMNIISDQGNNYALREAELLDISIKILGEENVNEWCEKGITSKQLEKIIEWFMSQHKSNKDKKK